MGRPKASNPRSAQLLMRLTAAQMCVLESVSHLEGKTPSTYARELIEDHLDVVEQHPRVQADLANRTGYESEKGTATPLSQRRAAQGKPKPAVEAP